MAASHTFTIDPETNDLLNHVSRNEVRSPEFVLRDAIFEYAVRHGHNDDDAPKDSALRAKYDGPVLTEQEEQAEAEAAYEHYRQTGLHLTGQEVDEWLEKLERGEKATLPPCHT